MFKMRYKQISPRCPDPFYIVTYYTNWVKPSWTFSTLITMGACMSFLLGGGRSAKLEKFGGLDPPPPSLKSTRPGGGGWSKDFF